MSPSIALAPATVSTAGGSCQAKADNHLFGPVLSYVTASPTFTIKLVARQGPIPPMLCLDEMSEHV